MYTKYLHKHVYKNKFMDFSLEWYIFTMKFMKHDILNANPSTES